MHRNRLFTSIAFTGAIAAGAAVAIGLVTLARGDTTGAPGITKAFARIGRSVGQSMLTGVTLTGAAAAATSVAVYEGISRLGSR